MKLYDKIKKLLIEHPRLRESDKELIWEIWNEQKITHGSNGYISKEDFIKKAECTETIRRTRQKVQEDCPDLQAKGIIKQMRDCRANTGDYLEKELKPVKTELVWIDGYQVAVRR